MSVEPSEPLESDTDGDGLHRALAPVLWLSLAVLALSPFVSGAAVGRATMALMMGFTAILALRRSNARRVVVLGGEAIVVAITLITAISRELGSAEDALTTLATGLMCILLLITPLVIVFRLAQRPKITGDTVAGVLAAYIQIGLFFATLFRFVQLVENSPFFSETNIATNMDFQFFSFVTLTTLGYGDLVPANSIGQSLAMMEAIIGQVFLVTVVALAVGNIGASLPDRKRGSRAGRDGDGAQAAPR
jgi:hypothetical protein